MNVYVEQLTDEIHEIIDTYRHESELNYAELIGALEMIKMDISLEALDLCDCDNELDGI